MHRSLLAVLLAAAPALAVDGLHVWWPDGAGLEIKTHSTGSLKPESRTGRDTAIPGYDYHRIVYGKDTVLFAYDIAARKALNGSVEVDIRPVDNERVKVGGNGKWLELPTFDKPRRFPPLRPGDTVELTILQNPRTGEQISDTLRVLPDNYPGASRTSGPEKWQLDDPRVVINGTTIQEQAAGRHMSMRGGGLMLRLPGRGAYFFSFTEKPNFKPAGWVDGNALRFHAGDALVEVFGANALLQNAQVQTIWVYRVPGLDHGGIGFSCGDSTEQLMELSRVSR